MTTTVDFDAAQAARGPRITILKGEDVDRAGTSGDFTDFSSASSVYVEAAAVRRFDPLAAGTLTLTVEHSDDGMSWSTAHEFDFTRDAELAASVSSPKAYWRASWTVAGDSQWRIVEIVVTPATIDQAGGGSLPAGGDTGQVLTKASNADGDVDWEDSGGGSVPEWEAITVPTDAPSWTEEGGGSGNWDFTDGVITFTNAGSGDSPVIVTNVDHFGQAWAVESEVAVVDPTMAFAITFNAGAWLYNAAVLEELDGTGFEYINPAGGANVQIFSNLYANSGSTTAQFAAPDTAYHRIRVVNLPLVQQAYFDDVLVGQNFTAPQSGAINPTDGLKESRFLIWDGGTGGTVSQRNFKAWRIPLPTFPV